MAEQTVAEYLVARLAKLGITDCFGVPGDFAFPLNDAIASSKTIRWRGMANELNAAYAADGYARLRGVGMLCTTYAVGELSALNGVMGSKAENVPVFHLVGMPSMAVQPLHRAMHHTLGDGVYQNFTNISAQSACAHAVLTPDNCAYEIERVIGAAMKFRQPGYFVVAEDMALRKVTSPPIAEYPMPPSDETKLQAALDAALKKIQAAKTGCILPSYLVQRYGLETEMLALIEKSGLPFATTAMDKAAISESHPQYVGMYAGDASMPEMKEIVEGADVLINAGHVLFSDLSTAGSFSQGIEPSRMITIGANATVVDDVVYTGVRMRDIFVGLAERVKKFAPGKSLQPELSPLVGNPDDPITSESLYPLYQRFFRANDIICAETGTTSISCFKLLLPENAIFQNQTLWGSIGWATPAALGMAIAKPSRRTVLITGEGSHQLTANEIGSFARFGAKPVIFVLNNEGYTIERALEDYPDWAYNDLAPWQYSKLPAAMGCKDWFTAKVRTNAELQDAMDKAQEADTGCYIEIVTDKHDYPPSTQLLHSRLKAFYGL